MKYSWLFPRNDTDTDQVRELLAPGQAGNAGWMFKRSDGTCLNAYLPSNDSEVISYNCNANDGDQQWDFGYWEAEGAWKLGRIGTNQCIDAPNLYDNGRVHMWSCSPGTGNQRWTLNSFPAPQWQVNNTSVASTGIAGTTPAMQAITVANVGMTYNGQIVGGPASIQIGNPNSWFSVAPGTTSLPRSKEHPNPNTALNINFAACSSTATNAGSFTVSGSGGNTVTVNVSRTCTAAPPPATWALSAAPVLATGTVGGSTTTGTFTASNAGNVAGTYTASATNGFTVSPASGSLNAGASATFTVTAPACTAVATQTSVLTLGGADTKTISLSRACTAAPVPVWSVSGVAAAFPAANVGSAGASTTFTLTNSGLGAGVPTLTSDSPAFITAALADSTPVAPGGTRSVTVSAAACTVAGPQQGTISVSGGGAALAALTTLSRVCLPAVPAAPSSLSVAMSSNGRLFVSWPTSASASSYSFSGSFDGQPLTVSGSAAALSGTRGSAVAAFGTAANDPSKQGKALCMQVQAVNAGGTSAFTAPVCATYQYYTSASLSAQSVESEPTLRLTLP